MKKRNLIIDLTSLLDVILIILFMVLVSNNTSTKEMKNTYERQVKDLQNKISSLEKSQVPGQKENDWYNVYQNKIGKMEITFNNEIENQVIKIRNNNNEEITKSATDSFENFVLTELSKYKDEAIIVTFKYDNKKILYKDYVNVRDFLLNVSSKINNKKIIYEELPQ